MTADHADNERVRVILPAGVPELTPVVARALLAILVELTEVPVLYGPTEGVNGDR
jgi:hypothetical protein